VLMLFHGASKLMNGIGGLPGMVSALGVPGFLAYAVYLGEVVAPLFVLSGFFVAPAALVMAINMIVAVSLAHVPQLFTLNARTGGYALELQAFFFFGSIAIALLAPRRGHVLSSTQKR
ncbi:MAG TPA: DoxX family protein, partial [Burkholderiaceae bacterium]|nr:DoxX family protein [Burkholderiaceae bacterium]